MQTQTQTRKEKSKRAIRMIGAALYSIISKSTPSLMVTLLIAWSVELTHTYNDKMKCVTL